MMKRAIYGLANQMARPLAFVALSGAAAVAALAGLVFPVGEVYFSVVNLSISVLTLAIGQAVLVAGARDEIALHLKLDRLIEASGASTDAIGIEHKDAEEVERARMETERRSDS